MISHIKTLYNTYRKKLNNIKPIDYKLINIAKKGVVSTVAIATLTLGVYTAHASQSSIGTIYHVYVNGERIGSVDDTSILENALDSKIDAEQKNFKQLELTIGNQVSFIPETTFRPNAENESTVKKAVDQVEVKANASAIVIDGEPVVYLASEEVAEEVLKQLKLDFVSEEELQELELRKSLEEELPKLQENETRLLDVVMTEKVSVLSKEILPKEILSTEEAVTYLKKGTLEEQTYEVAAGDVLGSIAQDHGLTTAELLDLNNDISEDSLLRIGDELNVTAFKPFIHIVVMKEMRVTEEVPYKQQVEEDSNMLKGETKVKQKGENGEKSIHSVVTLENGKTVSTEIKEEKVTKEAVDQIVLKGTKVIPSRGNGTLAWPASGGYISSKMGYRWGRMHNGIDIARPSNYTIKAADNGVVEFAGYDGAFGNKVIINHQNGLKTLYAHLSSISVSKGQTVAQGQQIGVMGSTGHSTGIHLHFEVHQNGVVRDPLQFLNR
ncbi:peptidoglycan DD-metalloendopeptidase family protein [Sutcliffiella cohnii]